MDVERLQRTFEIVESSGRAQVFGDSGHSWGLFQFQRARWAECGGQPSAWGKAGVDEQRRVMRRAIARYLRRAPAGAMVEAQVKHCARSHNGWGKASIGYAEIVWRKYCDMQRKDTKCLNKP